MKQLLFGLTVGAGLVLPLASTAHHSAAVLYHLDQQITVEGVVTSFTLGNPHARIFLTVEKRPTGPPPNGWPRAARGPSCCATAGPAKK